MVDLASVKYEDSDIAHCKSAEKKASTGTKALSRRTLGAKI